MAERRMFAKSIVLSDAFLDMPLSAQALYFHLSMRADDDGFLNNAKKIMRTIGANQNDYDLLVLKSFIIQFEDGICVIKHWRINNYLRNDRYKPTIYTEQREMLEVKENGRYTLKNGLGIPNGYQMETQVSIGKDSKDKDIKEKNIKREKPTRFTAPTLEEVKEYCRANNKTIDPEAFWCFYESKNWFIGKNKMTNWHMAIATWERNDKQYGRNKNVSTENKPLIEYRLSDV